MTAITRAIRLAANSSSFLNRKIGERGEIFFDVTDETLRIYDGNSASGTKLASEPFVTNAIANSVAGLVIDNIDTTLTGLLKGTGSAITTAVEDVDYPSISSITSKAPIDSPTFTGTVSGITAEMVGLGNVTNESKATMFTDPTFTGTVSGVTATMVGLGNVTNESKATMFTDPTFTGTVSGVTATMVGLGNVTNESKATMFSSPTFTGTTTLQQTTEKFTSPAIAANAVTLNFSLGAIFYLASNSANITANFTNIPTTSGQSMSTTLIIAQGATAYIPNAVTINTVSQTIKWFSNATPVGSANKIDVVNFTIICTATSTYTVLGSLSTFG